MNFIKILAPAGIFSYSIKWGDFMFINILGKSNHCHAIPKNIHVYRMYCTLEIVTRISLLLS